jgi:hypothetical protein
LHVVVLHNINTFKHNYSYSICVLFAGAHGQASGTGPSNTVMQSGLQIILNCHFPDSTNVDWHRNDTKISHNKNIQSPARPWTHRIVGNSADNEYNMRIGSVNAIRDVALYGCKFLVPSQTKVYWYKAHLIVIGKYRDACVIY